MTQSKTTAEANLELIQSVIPAEEKIYTWCYRIDGTFVASYCPKQMVHTFEQAFRALGGLRKAIEAISRPDPRIPMIIGSAVGIQWAVTLETERHNDLIFVIGPVRYSHPDEKQFSTDLHAAAPGYANLSWISFLCAHTDELPVVSYAVFTRYVIMIHNALTGSQAGLDALYDLSGQDGKIKEKQAGERNRMQIWMNEQAMLKMVREGNINYHEALKESTGLSGGVQMHGRDPLRQMKTSIIVFVTLVSRAAMEGGLSPETAYSLGDSYIQAAEDCHDSGELSSLAHTMYHDFIYRVHHARTNPGCSHAVQKCCDYIELNVTRKLQAADLARLVGYTEYYLTEKFRKETGISLSSYIRSVKISKAKTLLETTDLSVLEISEMLSFNTPNYFIQCFRRCEGITPAQYRKQKTAG